MGTQPEVEETAQKSVGFLSWIATRRLHKPAADGPLNRPGLTAQLIPARARLRRGRETDVTEGGGGRQESEVRAGRVRERREPLGLSGGL